MRLVRILLVENDELLGECICCGLGYYHYNVYWVKDSLAAWHFLQTEQFDLMILDFGLPNLFGEELLKNMRSENIIAPAIVMSSYDSIHNRIKEFGVGGVDCFSKLSN